MKSLLFLVTMTLVGYGLVGSQSRAARAATDAPAVADIVADPAPMISTNEGGCWDKCKKCEEGCRAQSGDAKRSCDDSCWSTNNTCCGGVGGKGVYKMCGCTDK